MNGVHPEACCHPNDAVFIRHISHFAVLAHVMSCHGPCHAITAVTWRDPGPKGVPAGKGSEESLPVQEYAEALVRRYVKPSKPPASGEEWQLDAIMARIQCGPPPPPLDSCLRVLWLLNPPLCQC
jgi:hypothetical protein